MAATYHHHKHDETTVKHHQVVVVVVPFPAQGHLGPSLQLSHKILSHNIPVHFAASPTHNRQAKVRSHPQSSVHFHDLPIPPFPSPPPDPAAPVKFPAHLQPAFEACLHLRQPVGDLLRSLSRTAKRVVVVHDPLLSSVVQDVACIDNAESYCFLTCSAFFSCLFHALAMGKPFPTQEGQIPDELLSIEGFFTPEFLNFLADQVPHSKIKSGDLRNSSRLIEGPYIDDVTREDAENGIKTWAIGPLSPITPSKDQTLQEDRCIQWLNKQGRKSVIYISFGTTTSISDDQIKELANGLLMSNVKFIWVMRDADRGDVFSKEAKITELPEGFEERVKGMGMVVRGWAPQLEILGHPAIGGFMTHCGWNSCLESITMGVPVVAWPMHSDQPANAVLLTKLLGIGLVVREWARRGEIVRSERVRDVVRRLMASEEGDMMRERAEKLGCDVRGSVMEGGVAHKELESFIAHISRVEGLM